jgi:hypothetical protein
VKLFILEYRYILDENPALQTRKYIDTAQGIGSVVLHQKLGVDKHGDISKLKMTTIYS